MNHAIGEMDELSDEIAIVNKGDTPGVDGVIGEAVDIVVCLIDLIYKNNPNITTAQLQDIIKNKCDKWLRVYGN
jgi:hypothetical protein